MAPTRREVDGLPALARAAAEEVVARAAQAVAARGVFRLALAGGSTPRALYALLADPRAGFRDRVDWARTELWFGDERCVPPDHPDSNFGMARAALLAHVPAGEVLRMEGERGAEAAAARYEAQLSARLGDAPLDLALLGLGADGHTASLFPGSAALAVQDRRVAAVAAAETGLPPHVARVTLTLPALDAARAALFLVAGAEKAPALARLCAPEAGDQAAGAPAIPAARVRAGEVIVICDRAAARTP